MIDWHAFVLLAENGDQQTPGFGAFMFPMIAILGLWYFLLLRPQTRDRKRRDEMIKALKKNDRVVTVGGIIGSVANVSADNKEITVQVNDNTRIKFLRSSIQNVVTEETKQDAS